MINILSRKTASGDICVNLALQYLNQHEWGMAKMALEQGLEKGQLSEPDNAMALLKDICRRMGVPDPD